MLLTVTVLTLLSNNAYSAATDTKLDGLVSIDSISLMQQSKEGQRIAREMQGKIENFQKTVQAKQQELISFQEEVLKQEKVLSPEALETKGKKLVQMKKDAERNLSDSEEGLKMEIQKQQGLLRNKQMKVANTIFETENWALMIDKNTPGVLFSSKAIDVTDRVLKAVDKNYDEEVVSNLVAKNDTTKTAQPAKQLRVLNAN